MSLKIDLLDAFKPNISLLKSMGAWHYNSKLLYGTYKNFVTFITFSFYLSTIIGAFAGYNDSDVTKNLYNLPALLESPTKLIMFRKNFDKILITLKLLQSPQLQPRNKTQEEILKKAVRLSKLCLKSFFYLTLVALIALFATPLIKGDYQLYVIVWFPFSYQRPLVFEIIYLYVTVCCLFCAYTNVAADSFLYISWLQIGAQLDCVCDTLKSLDGIAQNRNWKREKALTDCIQHYKIIQRYVKLFAEAYKEVLMVQFVCAAIGICVTMYQMSMEEGPTMKFVQLFLFQIISTFEVFCYCYFGDQITEKSGNIFYATFECKWCDGSEDFKKNLVVFMGQVREPVVFYAWNVIPINLRTFKGIMQKSWSFFIALKNTHELNHQ